MMVRRGYLPYSTIGRRIFIDRLEIERVLEASKTHAS
jgi:hypothetical protein